MLEALPHAALSKAFASQTYDIDSTSVNHCVDGCRLRSIHTRRKCSRSSDTQGSSHRRWPNSHVPAVLLCMVKIIALNFFDIDVRRSPHLTMHCILTRQRQRSPTFSKYLLSSGSEMPRLDSGYSAERVRSKPNAKSSICYAGPVDAHVRIKPSRLKPQARVRVCGVQEFDQNNRHLRRKL